MACKIKIAAEKSKIVIRLVSIIIAGICFAGAIVFTIFFLVGGFSNTYGIITKTNNITKIDEIPIESKEKAKIEQVTLISKDFLYRDRTGYYVRLTLKDAVGKEFTKDIPSDNDLYRAAAGMSCEGRTKTMIGSRSRISLECYRRIVCLPDMQFKCLLTTGRGQRILTTVCCR